jgi:conjugative relaxase-like TrwC/TraI family protein
MTLGSWRYYDHELRVEDYFLGHGEEQGAWVGSGAAALGLSGTVGEGQLARLFDEGRHPFTGEPLGLSYRHDSKRTVVTGFALSFSPPKSVSLVGAFGGAPVAGEVRAAHDAAVTAALRFLEDHAGFSRTGRGGVFQVDTEGFVAACFTHHTSRAGDPQLHAHVLVANKVRCADGKWRSLDGRELFAFQKAAGMLYNATLRVELTARLGVEWEPVDRNGQADIRGVPRGLIERFSKRRKEVEVRGAQRIAAAEARLGRTLTDDERAEQYQFATYETRAAKTDHEDEATLGGRWRTEAAAAGWEPDLWLPATLGRSREGTLVRSTEVAEPAVVDELVGELAEVRSTWGRAEVAKAVARRLPPDLADHADAGRAWIETTSVAVLAHPEVVTLAGPLTGEVPDGLRRRDGLPTHERHGTSRHSTRETLRREGEVLDAVSRGRDAGVAVAAQKLVERAVIDHNLGDDQAAALRRVCLGGETVLCVVGPAGAGKTRLMRAAGDVWAASGITVRGLAVSAVAAGVLTEESGLSSETLAKFLYEQERPNAEPAFRLAPGEVVVLDESGMVSTADLARLVGAVQGAGAKLVLVGDHRQLGAVDAGGLFRLLVADSRAAELSEVRRFSDLWEAKASLRLRSGDASVLDEYHARGRIAGGDQDEMVEEAFSAWLSARRAGESVVVVAPDHAMVDALALRARAVRVKAGEVEPGGLVTGAQVVGQGDEIVTTRNDRRLITTTGVWVRNGDRWCIDTRHPDGSLVVCHLGNRGRVVLPAPYVAGHVALAYAVTVHKAEGVTVDRAVLLADSATMAEHLYVGMTRGRHENRACVVTEAASTGHDHRPPPGPVEVLAAVMRRSSAEVSATETLRQELDRGEQLVMLRRLWEQARAHIDAAAGPDRRPELRRLRRLRSDLPMLHDIVAVNRREVARVNQTIAATRQGLAEAQARLETLTRHRRFRRPDQHAIDETKHRIQAQQRYLGRLHDERARRADLLGRSQRRLQDAEHAVARSPEVEDAIARRSEWLLSHPAELAWEADLATRLAQPTNEPEGRAPAPDHAEADHDLEALLRSIDLRTIDPSPRPRTGIDHRTTDKALGLTNRRDRADIALPSLPGHGIDAGPDLGL